MNGIEFINYYETHKKEYKYKMSDDYKKEHEDYEDPWADNCVGSDSVYYVGWDAFMIGDVPVFITVKRHEWVTELTIHLTKESFELHNQYEWIKLVEESGAFKKNENFSLDGLCGLAKDIAEKRIGDIAVHEYEIKNYEISIIVDYGFGVNVRAESPYLITELKSMKELKAYMMKK